MRPFPGGKSVGGKPGMHEDNRGFHAVILQVGIKFGHLHGREHAFEHDGAGRQAGDVKIFVVFGIADRIGGALANDVEFAFKCHGVGQVGTATNENLPHNGFTRPGGEAQIEVVGGHFAPAEDFLTFFLDNILNDLARFLADGSILVIGHENHADTVATGVWQVNTPPLAGVFEESMWNLHQNTSTVARVVFGAARAPVVETDEGFEGHFDDLVGFFAFDIYDKSDATGVAFVFGVVESVLAGICHKVFLNHMARKCQNRDPALAFENRLFCQVLFKGDCIDFDVFQPFVRRVFFGEDRFNWAFGFTGPAVDAFFGMNIEHIETFIFRQIGCVGFVDAVHRTNFHTGLVHNINAWLGDNIGHFIFPFLCYCCNSSGVGFAKYTYLVGFVKYRKLKL